MPWCPAYNYYWKLLDYKGVNKDQIRAELLYAGHRSIPLSTRKNVILAMMHRVDRGLLVYESCTEDELRKFIADRRLSEQPRFSAIKLLQFADDRPAFHKFMQLPPEMRLLIYERYIASFPNAVKCPAQPPLARVSRLIREEFLPLFYEQTRFIISYLPDSFGHNPIRRVLRSRDTSRFLESVMEIGWSDIRFIQLELRIDNQTDPWSKDTLYKMQVDLKGQHGQLMEFGGSSQMPQQNPWQIYGRRAIETAIWETLEQFRTLGSYSCPYRFLYDGIPGALAMRLAEISNTPWP